MVKHCSTWVVGKKAAVNLQVQGEVTFISMTALHNLRLFVLASVESMDLLTTLYTFLIVN